MNQPIGLCIKTKLTKSPSNYPKFAFATLWDGTTRRPELLDDTYEVIRYIAKAEPDPEHQKGRQQNESEDIYTKPTRLPKRHVHSHELPPNEAAS